MTRRRLALLSLVLPAALLLYCVAVLVEARVRTPRVLGELRSRGALVVRATDLPRAHLAMLLSVEDPAFRTHRGVDLSTPGAGITTITQAIVKRLFFKEFKPGFAKLRQTLIALVFDAQVPKDEQLEVFLNVAYFGHLEGRAVLGFDDAARTWVGRPPHELSSDEFLSLVAMLVGPNEFNPRSNPGKHAQRVERIRRLLAGTCRPEGNRDVYYDACG